MVATTAATSPATGAQRSGTELLPPRPPLGNPLRLRLPLLPGVCSPLRLTGPAPATPSPCWPGSAYRLLPWRATQPVILEFSVGPRQRPGSHSADLLRAHALEDSVRCNHQEAPVQPRVGRPFPCPSPGVCCGLRCTLGWRGRRGRGREIGARARSQLRVSQGRNLASPEARLAASSPHEPRHPPRLHHGAPQGLDPPRSLGRPAAVVLRELMGAPRRLSLPAPTPSERWRWRQALSRRSRCVLGRAWLLWFLHLRQAPGTPAAGGASNDFGVPNIKCHDVNTSA